MLRLRNNLWQETPVFMALSFFGMAIATQRKQNPRIELNLDQP